MPSSAAPLPRWQAALLYAAALVLGVGATWAFLRSPLLGAELRIGPWRTSLVAGSPQADAYTRAKVAHLALLALAREETLYFIAERDDAGQPLRARCRYRIEGVAPPARWWSLTAYADDMFLFADSQRRYGIDATRAQLDGQRRFVLQTGPTPAGPDGAYLPTPGDGGLVLTLRLYQPAVALAREPAALQPPRITAIGACP